MKKILALILALTMVFALVACGGEKEPTTTTTEPATTPVAADFEPITAEWPEGIVTLQGAELFTDTDDEPAVRIYYDYTNKSEETKAVSDEIEITVLQDGVASEYTYASFSDDVPEYGNSELCLRPGATLRCIEELEIDPEGGIMEIRVSDNWGDVEYINAELDPRALPGRPAQDLVIAPVTDPTWTNDLALEGVFDEENNLSITVTGAESVTDIDGKKAIRIYFGFTNGSSETADLWMDSTIRLFQDGIELKDTIAEQAVAADSMFTADVAPGETVEASNCYILLSDSPVELEVYDSWGDGSGVGGVFS